MPSEITFQNCIRARVSFKMQSRLLCAGLVTSQFICLNGQLVLAVSRFVRIAKTVGEYNIMASGVTLPPL